MCEGLELKVIARIHTMFPSKFGVPRQSGLVDALEGRIVFEKEYRRAEALRGLEGFSHLWLIWEFSEARREGWSPTVRPPRLGGNRRMGVFATRSPFRPNPLGLSVVRLVRIEEDPKLGLVPVVAGADLVDGTPIYDIKPYLPFVDRVEGAIGGFADEVRGYGVKVVFPEEWMAVVPMELREGLLGVLAEDPRPQYQKDGERVYGMRYGELEVRFRVADGVLTVCEVVRVGENL